MAVIRIFRYFSVASLLNANVIFGSLTNQYLRSSAPISLFDLLQNNDVGIKRIDSNEAEDLIKSIVKHNRVNNDRPKIIPLNRIIPPDSESARDKINENVVKNYVAQDLLADLLSDNRKINGIIPPDFELETELIPKNFDTKYKQVLHSVIPPDYELIKNRDIPPDHELVRHGKLQQLMPPDDKLIKNIYFPPDYELLRSILQDFIPPDHEFVRNGKLRGQIPHYYESIKNRDGIPPDYEFIKNKIIRPEMNSRLPVDYKLADIYDRPQIYLEERLSDDASELEKIIIKRIVSSNKESPLNEYKTNNNAYLRPLGYASHPLNYKADAEDDLVLIRSPNNEDPLAKFSLFGQRFTNKNQKNANQYRPLTYKEEKIYSNLIKHIQYLMKKIKSPVLKTLALSRVLDILRKMDNLRAGDGDSGRIINPAPLSAYVPFFNYWTYQKTVVEDDCPEDSVKIGNVCSRTPPH